MSDHDFEREHRDCAEALGAFVLHALAAEEAGRVERHLVDCQCCRDDIAALQLAVNTLPTAAPPVQPSPELKQRIMGVVEAEAELLRAAGSEADRPEPDRAGRRFRLTPPRPVVAAAAAAVVAAAVVVGFVARGGSGGQSARTVAAEVTGAAVAFKARAALRMSGTRGTLVVANLPDPPPNRVYEVWVKRPRRQPEPAGATFTLRSGQVEIPGSMRGVDAVMVTDERRGGSAAPTRTPIIVARPA